MGKQTGGTLWKIFINSMEVSQKTKIEPPYDLAIPLLDIAERKQKH